MEFNFNKAKKLIRDYKLINKSINDNHCLETFPIKCLCFEKNSNILFMGDETGYVKAYDITEYVNYLKLILPCSKIEYSNAIPNFEKKTELTKELKKKKENGTQIRISLSELLEIANLMDFTPILKIEA